MEPLSGYAHMKLTCPPSPVNRYLAWVVLWQPGRTPGGRRGIGRFGSLAGVGKARAVHRPFPMLLRSGQALLAQQDGFRGGVIADLHPQQFADGPDGQIVGLAAGGVGVEDGGGNLLAVGGSDGGSSGKLCLPVQGHVCEAKRHLAAVSQGCGAQGQGGQRGQASRQEPRKSFFHQDHPFCFCGTGIPSPFASVWETNGEGLASHSLPIF